MSKGRLKLNNFSFLKNLSDKLFFSKKKYNNKYIKILYNDCLDLNIYNKVFYIDSVKVFFKHDLDHSIHTLFNVDIIAPQYKIVKNNYLVFIKIYKSVHKKCFFNSAIYIYININKIRLLRHETNIFNWLLSRFSKCFNINNKLPLKIGIVKDISLIYKYEYGVSIDNFALCNVIKKYVSDINYQKSIIKYQKRFDLHGNVFEICSPENIMYAKNNLLKF